jgi:hypothetical protein
VHVHADNAVCEQIKRGSPPYDTKMNARSA